MIVVTIAIIAIATVVRSVLSAEASATIALVVVLAAIVVLSIGVIAEIVVLSIEVAAVMVVSSTVASIRAVALHVTVLMTTNTSIIGHAPSVFLWSQGMESLGRVHSRVHSFKIHDIRVSSRWV